MVKYYAVRKGRKPGVYSAWDQCKKQVDGFSGAEYKSFPSIVECEAYINDVKVAILPVVNIATQCIYIDGGCNAATNSEAWGSVVDAKGNDLIGTVSDELLKDLTLRDVILPKGKRRIIVAKFKDVATQQNNGAELLAMIAGLRIALKLNNIKILYSDSDLMIKWWSRQLSKEKNTELQANEPLKLQYILELQKLRKEFEARGCEIRKTSGADNLADLGYHSS